MAGGYVQSEAINGILDGCMEDEEIRNRPARDLLEFGAYQALKQAEWEVLNLWDLRYEHWKKKGNPHISGTYEEGWRDALRLIRTLWWGQGTLEEAMAESDRKGLERANRDFRALRAGMFGFIVKERENRESES